MIFSALNPFRIGTVQFSVQTDKIDIPGKQGKNRLTFVFSGLRVRLLHLISTHFTQPRAQRPAPGTSFLLFFVIPTAILANKAMVAGPSAIEAGRKNRAHVKRICSCAQIRLKN